MGEEEFLGSEAKLSDFRVVELDSFPSVIPSFQQPLYHAVQSLHSQRNGIPHQSLPSCLLVLLLLFLLFDDNFYMIYDSFYKGNIEEEEEDEKQKEQKNLGYGL